MSNTEVALPADVRAKADALKAILSIEGSKLVIPEGAFESTLEEGRTVADVKKVQSEIALFARSMDVAGGELIIEHMATNPDVATIFGSTKVGKDTYNMSVDRTRNLPAGIGAGRKEVYGHVSSGINAHGGATKKVVVSMMQQYGASMLNRDK